MALFGKKKEEVTEAEKVEENVAEVKEKVSVPVPKARLAKRDLSTVILKPRITEKAVLGTDKSVYTFEIHADATKGDVKRAVKKIFNVTPVKVNIVKKSPRQTKSRARGRMVNEQGLKKAYVYLKKGERIDLV